MVYPIIACVIGFILVLLKSWQINRKDTAEVQKPNTTSLAPPVNTPPKKGQTHPQHIPQQQAPALINKAHSKQKRPNKTVIEILQYCITIAAAFIGLSTTFYLNTIKTENDKRKHLITVLQRFHQDQTIYRNYLNGLDIDVKQMGDTLKAMKNSLSVHEYPYFANIKDPAAFEVSKFSIPLLSFVDYQVRVSFGYMPDRPITQTTDQVKKFLDCAITQVEYELQYQDLKGPRDTTLLFDQSHKNYTSAHGFFRDY